MEWMASPSFQIKRRERKTHAEIEENAEHKTKKKQAAERTFKSDGDDGGDYDDVLNMNHQALSHEYTISYR